MSIARAPKPSRKKQLAAQVVKPTGPAVKKTISLPADLFAAATAKAAAQGRVLSNFIARLIAEDAVREPLK